MTAGWLLTGGGPADQDDNAEADLRNGGYCAFDRRPIWLAKYIQDAPLELRDLKNDL
jgi:hypothetical protein